MADADRPEGDDPGRAARLRVFRGGRPRSARALPASPGDVARRLSALERRVEKALAATSVGRETIGADVVRTVTDQVLGTLASLRRLTPGDVQSAVEDWSGFAAGLENDVASAVLAALYRYWWRVEAVGLERVPARGRVLLVANRSGALFPWDALMIRVGLATDHPARRGARPVVDDWLASFP